MSLACHQRGKTIYGRFHGWIVLTNLYRMSDNTLTTLMGHVPSRSVYACLRSTGSAKLFNFRCILLLEDLDAAFTRSVSRDSASTGAPATSTTTPSSNDTNDGSTLSLSGLLNSLDGVAAAEGR